MTSTRSYWEMRLDLAEQTGRFTCADKAMAHQWTTCACGKKDPAIPRHTDEDQARRKEVLYLEYTLPALCWGIVPQGSPRDLVLRILGQLFDFHVHGNDVSRARRCLRLIERRAQYVLARSLVREANPRGRKASKGRRRARGQAAGRRAAALP